METSCLNCNQTITENFCSHCGQKKFKRIDKKYVWDEIQYTFLHTNKGFLYSVKNIIINPGKTAKNFIDGNRVNHYKPLLLSFVLSGISAFISFKFLGFAEVMKKFYENQAGSSQAMNDIMTMINSYNSIFMLLLIPLFALLSKLVFMKWGQNYYEHIVMNSYILSYYTLFNIILIYPILYFMKHDVELFSTFSGISMIFTFFIAIWFYKEFYNTRSLKTIILRVLAIFGLLVIVYFVFIMVVLLGVVVYTTMKGPEAMEYFKPIQLKK
ncbi:DUF3667 domain-containing protein [Chryseobacterium nematophagum]|uniref:DUF3667 domain-containing protein n=1 Tax=Chryseobacterium nematophagum TaxID=2305228 RepID=A0A3M7LCM0_9FLAO|nr:DUF3667 domain-containing protein [Chryseobacterium nematophagum]RMZ59794.1 DUF3667 domain-containing protein [Chryseobacterium nematophagum]